MNNRTRNVLRVFGYAAHELDADLTRQVNLHELVIRISATVDGVGGDGAGTVVEDGPARLLANLALNHDGRLYVDNIGGRDLFLFGRRCHARVRELTTLASAAIQAGTEISAEIVVTFSPKFAANPHELCIPAMPVQQQYKALFQLETARTNATSSEGTAALVSGGTTVFTISGFQMEVVEITSTSPVQPLFIPVYTKSGTDQFSVADDKLDFDLKTGRPIAAQLFAYRYGSLRTSQDGINSITLQASNVQKMNRISYEHLKGDELRDFPAVPTDELGTVFINYLDNGRLGQALNPVAFGSNPRYTFDVDAPTSSPGRIEVLSLELARREPFTR